jgi:hypothetical protein
MRKERYSAVLLSTASEVDIEIDAYSVGAVATAGAQAAGR